MRLLRRDKNNGFTYSQFYGDSIPPYAVLSHTWGTEDDEVSFSDLVRGRGQDKSGYKKVIFCADLVEKDNLSYFWVDTCCIDKTSSAELSEALNSMFRWYKNAARCYVYLKDMPKLSAEANLESSYAKWSSAFTQNRWFTRGWTLQELLAPQAVEFYSSHGVYLGDKRSLEQEISETTNIDVQALRGVSLDEFSFDDKMSWARGRQTTREEDAAYCLQGLFGVHMLPIYGEGRARALDRLNKEINRNQPCEINLFDAIRQVRLDLVSTYLQHSVFIDYATLDEQATTPLHMAVQIGHDGILGALLDKRPRVDCYDGQGTTPLMLAAFNGNTKAMQRLLDSNCALELPLRGTRQTAVTGIDIDGNITIGSTALLIAAQNGFVNAVKLLLSRGARTNTATSLGFSPLLVATASKHCDCITALLDAGADIEVRNCHNFTPLICCGNTGFIAGAALLLDADADIEAEKDGGMTALLEAIFHGRTKFVEFIIERGANLAARCSLWNDVPEATALHVAVCLKKRRMVETLLRYGADFLGRDGKGRTAEELAKETGQHSLSQFLGRWRQSNVSVSTDLDLPEPKAKKG